MWCIEQIASVSNITDKSKTRDLALFPLCRFWVISIASGRNYGDAEPGILCQDICI
jgi:hypothetical protein